MKRVAVVGLLGLSFGLAVLDAQAPSQGQSLILERIIVRVNGEIFTQSQLTDRQSQAIRQRNRDAKISDAAVMKLIGEVTPDVLVDTIDELLLAQHGRDLGAKFTDDTFKQAVEGIKKDNSWDDNQLKQAMAQEGLSLEQLRADFERSYMVRAVQQQEVFRRMNITDEELRQFYSGHKEQLMTPETVTLRELTVAGTLQETEAARQKIEGIRAKALAGEDFAGLVKTLSDSATKDSGGLIGPLKAEDINPALKALIDKLKPGEITEPVPLPRGGFQIFQLASREAPALPPFDKARTQIEQGIRAERLDSEMEKIVSRLRSQAVIEWKDDTLKQIYQKRLVERTAPQPARGQ